MNVDEAMRKFAEIGELPCGALQWALDNWDDASPRFIAKLRAYAAGATDVNLDVLFYVIHMCGEKCDSRAYVPLCQIIASDETLDIWFGDATSAHLAGILINICDGDAEPLKRAIEGSRGDEFARSAAIEALAYLVRAKGVLTDDEMRAYLSHLADEMQPREEHTVWSAWAFAIAMLGYEPLRGEVARMFSRGWLDRSLGSLDDFYQDLQLARSEPDGMAAFSEHGVEPFGSTIESLESWPQGEEQDSPDEDDESDVDADRAFAAEGRHEYAKPYVNPFRDVGRNDPCPCHSGKKYKKCCLAA